MIHEIFDIDVDYEKAGIPKPTKTPILELYVPMSHGAYPEQNIDVRTTVLIVPGGGYHFLSENESDPIAVFFMNAGCNCAILRYSVSPDETIFPAALMQEAKALYMLKEMADKYGIDRDRIFTCGFSAGGHLAASLGVFWNRKFLKDLLGIENDKFKPAGTILEYPVLVNHGKHHQGSFINLLGSKYGDKELMELTSLEKQVSDETTPMYIMHTIEDTCVPLEGTLLFTNKLREHGVPFELHIYDHGNHGISTASRLVGNQNSRLSNWMTMAVDWMFGIQ